LKRKIISVLFALVLVLSFSLVTAVPAMANTDRLVPSEYATIQLAIDAAVGGDTIIVAAGDYEENLVIDEALTLKSAAGAATTTIDASGEGDTARGAVNIGVSNVTLGGDGVGFTIIAPDATGPNPGQYGVELWTPGTMSGVTIEGNTIEGSNAESSSPQYGIHFWRDVTGGTFSSITIKDNTFTTTFVTDTTIEDGLSCGMVARADVVSISGTFDGNSITGYGKGIMLHVLDDDTTFSDNTVQSCYYEGIDVSGTGTLTISGNTVSDNAGAGVDIRAAGADSTVTQNSIHGNGDGVKVRGDISNITVQYNDIYSNTNTTAVLGAASGPPADYYKNYGVYNQLGSGSLDAEYNWWGAATGPTIAGNPLGSGDEVSDDVDYSPWEGALTDTSPMTWYTNDVIQDAIDVATAGDTVNVLPGTYNAASGESFPIQIDTADVTLQSTGTTAETIIDATAGVAGGIRIGGTPGAPVTTLDVTVDGFTVTVDSVCGIYLAGADDAIIQNNVVNASTLGGTVGGIDVSWYATGVMVSGNTLDEFGSIIVHGSDCTVSGNTVGRDIVVFPQASQTIEGSIITDNTFPTLPTETVNGAINLWGGNVTGSSIEDTLIQGNTLSNRDQAGIRIGTSYGANLTVVDLTITGNTITANTQDGIYINADVTWGAGNTINYNDISGNGEDGIDNDTTTSVDARYNWWGACTGPDDDGDKNPYHAQAGIANAETCSLYVDFIPWMIHTELASGWNIYSTPIASGTSTDTIDEALDLWTTDSGNLDIAYYFNSSASPQAFAEVTSLTPLEAVYVKMNAAATMDVCFSSTNIAPPSRVMYQGWNLVGPAELYNRLVDVSLSDALYGTGEAALWGYSKAISPPLYQTYWTYLREGTTTEKNFIPTNGYWVYMVNQGTLAGFTSTPITELP